RPFVTSTMNGQTRQKETVVQLQPNQYRTHTCGQLRETDAGSNVVLSGWVQTNRDMGGVIFIDLRDKHGVTQVVVNPELGATATLLEEAAKVRSEWVIRVEGPVRIRPEGTRNDKLPTGNVELAAAKVTVLNKAKTPPIEIRDDLKANDDIRLEFR